MGSEEGQADAIRQAVSDRDGAGLGQHHLAPMGDGFQAGHTVDGWAEVVAVAFLALTGVHSHPDPESRFLRPCVGVQSALGLFGCFHCFFGRGEDGAERVFHRLEYVATRLLDGRTHQGVVSLQGGSHRLWMLLPQAGRPLDVTEQEGDGPGRQRHLEIVPHPGVRWPRTGVDVLARPEDVP